MIEFYTYPGHTSRGIEAEVERLKDFFKTKIFLEYERLSSISL